MSSNALSGSLLGFTESLATLQKLDMSNQRNGFVGLIPDNIWRSLSLEILNLADNRLTGSIPSLVGKMTALEEFDLSNNNLTNVIPSELGKLDGTLQLLGLSNNALSGIIPAQIGQLQGASIFLKDNRFDNSSTAPLSLCLESEVNEFDLKNDTTSCPIERNALSDFYDSTKGAEWTDSTKWLAEYGYCDWHGVTCDDGKKHVTNLTLANNGLSGRLRESIGELTFIEKLDLSDNDIKASIPTEIGLLSELTYLRLSYNAFTGTAPGVLGELANLQLLQLQSNRITKIPDIIRLDDTEYGNSAFVTDCGVPSAFDKAPKCKDCTMCCNANDDCYPQEDIPVTEYFGLNYVTFAAVFFAFFVVLCCLVAHSLYLLDNRKYHRNSSFNALSRSVESERRIGEEDDNYALSRIGKNSVYSYFVTDKPAGWLIAFATLGIQTVILVLFIMASEANLQDDAIDIEFTWKCPRDSDRCDDKADWTKVGWFIFCVLMIAFLSKDMVGGCKLIYHSSKIRHTRGARNRYLVGGTGLCSITVFALYVSTVYNRAIATSNTDLIVNSVVVLFIMDLDEWIFFALDAINEKWTEHAADAEVSRMKEEIARQRAQLASQQKEIDDIRNDLRKLCETVELQSVWSRWEY